MNSRLSAGLAPITAPYGLRATFKLENKGEILKKEEFSKVEI